MKKSNIERLHTRVCGNMAIGLAFLVSFCLIDLGGFHIALVPRFVDRALAD